MEAVKERVNISYQATPLVEWERVKLGDVCEIVNGKNQSAVINPNGKYPIYGSSGIFGYADKYLSNEGSTIIGRKGNINSPIYVTTKFWNVDTAFAPNSRINGKFLFYFCKGFNFHALDKSTTIPSLAKTDLLKIDISLPPLREQHAIVSKIEELFSELDKGKQQLETTQQQLKIYRQTVLKWAFEGKLTNKNVKEGELPEGWKWVKLGDTAEKITDGEHFRPQTQENGIPFLSAKDIRDEGVSFAGPLFISEQTAKKALQRCNPERGDILIVSRGATVGRMCIVNTDKKFCLLGSVILIKVNKAINSKYVNYVLKSPFANQKMIAVSGATAQQAIYLRDIKNIEIPVCDIEEQELIVQEIESRLSVCDKIVETIANSLQQVETLRQSILKKAFKGKLITHVEVDNIRALQFVPEAALSMVADSATGYKEKTKVIQFPKVVEGISTTDLHAGVLAMVIDAHASSPKHHSKLSHVKGEKIAHLVEAHLGIELGRVPKKDAAGPDDFPHLKKVESRATKAGWFVVKKLRVGQTYTSKSGMPKVIDKVKNALPSKDFLKVEALIKTFLPFDLEHAEVIATLYAGWNNLLLDGKMPTDEEIVYESRENWSKRKLRIEREVFFKALKWMREHGITPNGEGKKVLAANEYS